MKEERFLHQGKQMLELCHLLGVAIDVYFTWNGYIILVKQRLVYLK